MRRVPRDEGLGQSSVHTGPEDMMDDTPRLREIWTKMPMSARPVAALKNVFL